jgi:nucleoside-diphosphate-sugar epimerase
MPPPESVLFAVGYDRGAGASIHDVYVHGLRHCCDALRDRANRLRSFVYISSTGVYGRVDGDWVDESSPCVPAREGGRACLEAERLLAAGPFGDRAIILRCAGLYGPERLPLAAAIQAGEPIAAPADGFLNLIHIDDAARIAVWAADDLPPPELLNVADGHPVVRREYYAELARALAAPPPVFATPMAETPAATRAAGGDKRVRSDRLLGKFPGPLLYPSYREGLRAR